MRAFFAEKLGYEEDLDFADHISVTQQQVKEFVLNNGPGPSLDDLHLDCSRGKSSQWNKAAMALMAGEFNDELETDEDVDWPDFSSGYIDQIVWERFARLMTIYKRSQPQINSDGEEEDPRQQETRIVAEREADLKERRHGTRRHAVRDLLWC